MIGVEGSQVQWGVSGPRLFVIQLTSLCEAVGQEVYYNNLPRLPPFFGPVPSLDGCLALSRAF